MNIIHDAVHDTVFKSQKLNNLYVFFFDLMGAVVLSGSLGIFAFIIITLMWKGGIPDIEQSKIFRVFLIANIQKCTNISISICRCSILFIWPTGCWLEISKIFLIRKKQSESWLKSRGSNILSFFSLKLYFSFTSSCCRNYYCRCHG